MHLLYRIQVWVFVDDIGGGGGGEEVITLIQHRQKNIFSLQRLKICFLFCFFRKTTFVGYTLQNISMQSFAKVMASCTGCLWVAVLVTTGAVRFCTLSLMSSLGHKMLKEFVSFFFPKVASQWNWNRHWKWLSLQFDRRKFDHQQPQWNEGFWTVSMFNHQHVWQYFKQRGCSSVCMWVIYFLKRINQIFLLLDKALNCNLHIFHKLHCPLCWVRISKLEIKFLVGKNGFLWTFYF